MPTVALFDQTGNKIKNIKISDEVFGIDANPQVIYDVIKAQRRAMRQGSQKVKTRSEVRGGGRKPWRQKGTGRSRQGTIRSPLWRGGGVVFAPVPRDYSVKVNRKVRQAALRQVYSLKVKEEEFRVVDQLVLEEVKTKEFAEILKNLKTNGRTLVVLAERNENVIRACRNIPKVSIDIWDHVSCYDVMRAQSLIIINEAVKQLEEVLG